VLAFPTFRTRQFTWIKSPDCSGGVTAVALTASTTRSACVTLMLKLDENASVTCPGVPFPS
jgi:hypothetical protein